MSMSISISVKRELLAGFKKDIHQNVSFLSFIYPAKSNISTLIFKEESYDKPKQQIFMHLSYYLATIIDHEKSKSFSWPLYDSKIEKQYRADITSFLATYASKGIISPVVASFLVNPGCFKVVKLMFQLSQLAIQKALLSKMNSDKQKSIYTDITQKYKIENVNDFIGSVEEETVIMLTKFSQYQHKREVIEAIANKLKKGITTKEAKLKEIKNKINTWKDDFLSINTLSEGSKSEIYFDINIDNLEVEWNSKVTPFLDSMKTLQNNMVALISRHTGICNKKSYILEYDPKSNSITTSDLEQKVNSEQKYVLKNIVKNGQLNFPNLVQGFVVSIGHILEGHRVDNINGFNECLDFMLDQHNEVKNGFRKLNDRVIAAEKRLQGPHLQIREDLQNTNLVLNIPPLPDLTDLRANTGTIQDTTYPFTPINISTHKFNLQNKTAVPIFNKPFSRSIDNLVTPFKLRTKDNFLNISSCKQNHSLLTNISQNMSIISHASNINNTIEQCSLGFTKQQLQRLLSTKKRSTKKKKFTPKTGKGMMLRNLFNEFQESGMFQSHSNPNLLEGIDKKLSRRRQLPKLGDASLLQVSGIDVLNTDRREGTPRELNKFDLVSITDNIDDTSANQQLTKLTKSANDKQSDIIKRTKDIKNLTKLPNEYLVLYNEIIDVSDVTDEKSKLEAVLTDITIEKPNPTSKIPKPLPAPKLQTPTMMKPGSSKQRKSLENILNRYKKVRANVFATDKPKEVTNNETFFSNNENINVDNFSLPGNLLRDLVSPSCFELESNFFDEYDTVNGRQSLGTVLGVDESILDNLIN